MEITMEISQNILNARLEICKNCKFNVYDIKPNFNICTKSEAIAITIVVQGEACPIGKW